MTELEKAAWQAAEDVSKAYDLIAWGHTERAAEILKGTRDALRRALAAAEQHKQKPCKYPNCPYPCPDLPDCKDAEQQATDKGKSCYCPNCEALAKRVKELEQQPAGEPVACIQDLDEVKRKHLVYEKGMDWKDPLYTHPQPAAPEFYHHVVKNEGDWSEWVNPDNDSYMMKCCDCGLVHEMQFKVAKYSEGDECEFVNDPDLQPVFRARRAGQAWQEKDTAHRAGGLPQPDARLHITDTDIDHLSVLAGFDPSHTVELGLVRSVVKSILSKEKNA